MEDDVTKDLAEFSLANAIYAALIEGHACEISARFVTNVTLPVVINRFESLAAMPWTMRKRMPVT